MDLIPCATCGYGCGPVRGRCHHCGAEIEVVEDESAVLVIPSWGRLRVRVFADPAAVLPALIAEWRGYEKYTILGRLPSQVGFIVGNEFTLYGPDIAAKTLPVLVAKRLGGFSDLLAVDFDPMSEADFDAAVSSLARLQAIPELLEAYSAGTFSDRDVLGYVLELIETHEVDDVVAALPQALWTAVVGMARTEYDNDVPAEDFITVESYAGVGVPPKRDTASVVRKVRAWLSKGQGAVHLTNPYRS